MERAGKNPVTGTPRLVLSQDVRISEKRGISRARDAKTGRLLSGGDIAYSRPPKPSRRRSAAK